MASSAGARHRAELPAADEGVLQLLRRSVAGIAGRQPDLVLAIHRQLLVALPGVTRLPGAGRPVARRLAVALLQAASVDDPTADTVETLRRIGAENQTDGLGPELASVVPRLLLRAARAVHRGEWSGQLSSAWVEYLFWLGGQLSAGATTAAVRAPEREPAPFPAPGRAARASGW